MSKASRLSISPVSSPAKVPSGIAISDGDGESIVDYNGVSGADRYEYRLDEGDPVDVGLDNPLTVDNITNGQTYDFQMRAVIDGTPGPWSNKLTLQPSADAVSTTVYTEDFSGIADGSAWPAEWTTADRAGNGNVAFEVNGERAQIITSGPDVVATADLENVDIEDTEKSFTVRSDLISNDVQPSYYVRARGDWTADHKRESYQFWFWDQKIHLVKTDSDYNLDILKEVANSLSADVDTHIDYKLQGSKIQWKVWQEGESKPSLWTSYTDNSDPILSGIFAIKLATTEDAPGGTVLEFDDFDIREAEGVPIPTIESAEDTEVTFSWSSVSNADSYEYRIDGGTETNVGIPSPLEHTHSGLTNGQTYELEMRAIVDGSPTSWSSPVDFTVVESKVIGVTIDQSNADVAIGENRELTATVTYQGSPSLLLTWKTSDAGTISTTNTNNITNDTGSQATVSGTVTGESAGSATITAESNDDATLSDSISGEASESTEPAEWFTSTEIQNANSQTEDEKALADLFVATNGDNWENQSGWSADPAQIDLSAGNEPFGVEAQTINGERRVTLIRLNNNGTGSPRTDIADRKGNGLTGFLPNSLGNLKEMTDFDVVSNQITGELPGGMRYCTSIQRAYFEGTKGYNPGQYLGDGAQDWGRISTPEERKQSLAGAKNQAAADWNYNNFSGRLPGEWSDWEDIRQVCIAATAINGSTGVADVTNCITGPLPPEWGQWTTIRQIFLSINAITGKLPPEWAGMVENVDLLLGGNQLGSQTAGHEDAVLPSAWGGGEGYGAGMRKLRHFSVGDGLSGVGPSFYFDGTQTSTFDGPWPENWGNIKMIHKIIYPYFNAKTEPPAFLNSGDFHLREYQEADWSGTNTDGETNPNPDADPVEAWMPGVTTLSGYGRVFKSMIDPSKITYLSRFVATGAGFNEQIPQNLNSWDRNRQFIVAGSGFTGPFPDIPDWNDCKIFQPAHNNFNSALPEVPGASGTAWRNVLAQNAGFTGQIPSSWGALPATSWIRLWLHNNNLSGTIPSGLAGNSYGTNDFKIYGNRYVFADIVPFLSSMSNPGDLDYGNMQKFGSSQIYTRSVGGSINVDPFSGDVGYSGNNYQWHKISGDNQGAVSGETNRALSLSNLQSSDAGDYELVVTNSSAPALTLTSRNVELKIS